MTKCARYYKVLQVLQIVTDCYYKVRQVLQSATVITKSDVAPIVICPLKDSSLINVLPYINRLEKKLYLIFHCNCILLQRQSC